MLNTCAMENCTQAPDTTKPITVAAFGTRLITVYVCSKCYQEIVKPWIISLQYAGALADRASWQIGL